MNSPRRQAAIGRWLVFVATVFWASTATMARFMFHDRHVNPLVVVELRLAIAATLLAAILVAFRRESLRIERRDIPYFLVLGLFGVAAVQGSYYYTISRLGVALAILIQYLAPVLIVTFDLVRGRWVGGTMIAAVLCALVGTALLVGNVNPATMHASPLDWGIAFLSAFVFAFYIVSSKRGLAKYRPETVLLYTFVIAGIFWSFVNPPWVILRSGYDAPLWGMFVLLGLFSTLVPFALFYMGLRRLPAAETGVIATTEPLVAMILAALFLHEHLRPLQIVGAGLVLMAGVLASRNKPEAVEASVERG